MRSRRRHTRKDRDRRHANKGGIARRIKEQFKRVITSNIRYATRGNREVTPTITIGTRPISNLQSTPSVTKYRGNRTHSNSSTTSDTTTNNMNRLVIEGRYMVDERFRVFLRGRSLLRVDEQHATLRESLLRDGRL